MCVLLSTFTHNNAVLHHVGELPVTFDLARYDRDSGHHNITIITNSKRGEAADYTHTFLI